VGSKKKNKAKKKATVKNSGTPVTVKTAEAAEKTADTVITSDEAAVCEAACDEKNTDALLKSDSEPSVEDGECEAEPKATDYHLFIDSVDMLTRDDLAPKKFNAQKAKKIVLAVMRIILLIVLGAVFAVSLYTVLNSFKGYEEGEEVYAPIAENAFDTLIGAKRAVSISTELIPSKAMPGYEDGLAGAYENDDVPVQSVQGNPLFEIRKANISTMRVTTNPDVFGLIQIEGTKIKYPVVKGTDNEFYLDHAYDKSQIVVGSIFVDYRCGNVMTDNKNTVFYGHNMADGSMFNNVMNFTDPEVFNNKVVEITTTDGIYIYKPFAIYKTVDTDQYFKTSFSSNEEFVDFCNTAQSKSLEESNYEFDGADTIITLSTCTPYDDVEYYGKGRYALHAVLIRVER